MKNLLLTISFAICFTISSCSSDDNNTNIVFPPVVTSSITATVNGAAVVFDTPTVVKENHTTEEGVPYTDLIVTAFKKNDPTTKVLFRLEHMTTGPESCYYFLYKMGDSEYDIENDGTGDTYAVNVTDNTANNIKGNFAGTLADFEGNIVTITNGTFNVTF